MMSLQTDVHLSTPWLKEEANMLKSKNAAAMMFVLSMAMAGCSSGDDNATNSSVTSSTSESPTTSTSIVWPANLPTEVVNRSNLPDCGQYDASLRLQGTLSSQAEQAMLDCFWTAYDNKRPAELRVVTPALDTPAVPTYYRTFGNGKNETIVLSSDGKSSQHSCPAFIKRSPAYPTCE